MFKKYMSVSFHVGSKKNAIPNLKKLKAIFIHNLRKYTNSNNPDLDLNLSQYNVILKGTNNLVEDVKKLYKNEFSEAVYNYNQKQNREERKITNYLTKVEEDKQKNIATELILQVGDREDWQNINMEDKKKMAEVFKNSLNLLESKGFKVANATLHLDETSPHLHVVGVPVGTGFKKGLEKQVSSKSVFSIDKLDTLRDEIEKTIIEDFNKVYNTQVEKKQEKALLQEHLSVVDFKELKPVLNELVKLTNKNIALEQVKQEIKKKDKQKLEQEDELKAKNKELSNVTEEIREIENEINNQEDIKKELEEKKNNTSNELKKKVLEQDFEIQKLKSEKNTNDILLDMHKQNIKRVAESIKEAKAEQEKKEKEKEEEEKKLESKRKELAEIIENRKNLDYSLEAELLEKREKNNEKINKLNAELEEQKEKIENLENNINSNTNHITKLEEKEKEILKEVEVKTETVNQKEKILEVNKMFKYIRNADEYDIYTHFKDFEMFQFLSHREFKETFIDFLENIREENTININVSDKMLKEIKKMNVEYNAVLEDDEDKKEIVEQLNKVDNKTKSNSKEDEKEKDDFEIGL